HECGPFTVADPATMLPSAAENRAISDFVFIGYVRSQVGMHLFHHLQRSEGGDFSSVATCVQRVFGFGSVRPSGWCAGLAPVVPGRMYVALSRTAQRLIQMLISYNCTKLQVATSS